MPGFFCNLTKAPMYNDGQYRSAFFIYSANPRNRTPKPEVDTAIDHFVGDNEYAEFIDEWLDNPWVKIAILGIEYLNYNFVGGARHYAWHRDAFQGLNGATVEVYVLYVPPNTENPKALLDDVVMQIANGRAYNAFVDSSLCNPYVRVVIFGINDILWNV